MKSLKYILAISSSALCFTFSSEACGPYYPENPGDLAMFRCCSPALERQWHDGCRFQDYEKYENCLLWQKITSSDIPLKDIEAIVYDAGLKDISELPEGPLAQNKFAAWLMQAKHSEDLDYILIAKEIEEIREYMTDPWYYAYDGDEEHQRLEELADRCRKYSGHRHISRYALQMARLCFAQKNYQACIDLWENTAVKMPRDIVSDMTASYAGGAYSRMGNREKAIELFTRSQDIGSLIGINAWNKHEDKSIYSDRRVKELEYIFNRFPDSPLLSIKVQEYVRDRERSNDENEAAFYIELTDFAKKAATSGSAKHKAIWQYSLSYMYYLDGKRSAASEWLSRAERSDASPFIKESVRALRFLLDATNANRSRAYRSQLMRNLKWLDGCMARDAELDASNHWQYDNKMNYSFYYWQDVARKVLLSEVCPRIAKAGDTALALQLANYASNRIYQIAPLYKAYHSGANDTEDADAYTAIIPFEDYRKTWPDYNLFDYSNEFFELINSVSANEAARYAELTISPETDLDRFLNDRSYVDPDYIFEIVGTLYLREMNYDQAVKWLSKVSREYQKRTNIAKEGYFGLDPFKCQFDKENYISESTDYKLQFAQKMAQLEKMFTSDCEPNRKANAKIRYATGLRNSFGKCWFLTQYGISCTDYQPADRDLFKDNLYAQKAYKTVDRLMEEALSEFTDPEQAAAAQLEMLNFKTVMTRYGESEAATYIRGHCDSYHDYLLQKR